MLVPELDSLRCCMPGGMRDLGTVTVIVCRSDVYCIMHIAVLSWALLQSRWVALPVYEPAPRRFCPVQWIVA
jgi:hypothetical protein